MKTNRLFKQDVYLKETGAVITSVKEDGNKVVLTFDKTVFFPTGGGQPSDLGTISGYQVLDVYEDGEDIYHVVDSSSSDSAPSSASAPLSASASSSASSSASASPSPGSFPFRIGETVHLSIDWERRFDNMQRHCGEHILSGVFYDLYGGVNRGFHMGDDYLTIDISLEDDPNFKEITWEMAKAAEYKTNEIIWQNLPVVAHHFDSREEAEKMPMRKKLAIDEDITIVTVGDPSNPADSVACCGTHPSTSGQIGMLKIYKVEPNKGMFRIFFEAGQRAFRNYEESFDVMSSLERDLSAGSGDLIEKYRARQDKQKEIRDRLYNLTKEVISREASSLESKIQAVAAEQSTDAAQVFIEETYKLLTIDDIIELGRSLEGRLPKLLFLIHSPSNTVFLFSDSADCGKLVKDNASVFNGKGGGNKNFARAIFTRSDDVDVFIQGVKNLMR